MTNDDKTKNEREETKGARSECGECTAEKLIEITKFETEAEDEEELEDEKRKMTTISQK